MLMLVLPASWAQVTPYSQSFESLAQADPDALANDGWLVYGNVYDSGGGYLYGYGTFPAPNNAGGFCGIASGEGGASQGAQQLSVFSDYNNGDHQNGYLIEANVFQEQTIAAGDVGTTMYFTFDAKMGNLELSSTALAFIKTLDPGAGWATTNFITEDMTSIPTTWGSYSLQITIDAGLVGQILQFGFQSTATNYEGSGIFYDNINFQPPQPLITLNKSSSFIGILSPGTTVVYTIVATNIGTGDALGVVINDTPDANTTLTVGTTSTTQGTVVTGNTAGDTSVSIDVGTLPVSSSVTVTFAVTVDNPLPAGVTEVSNQAFLSGSNVTTVSSNVNTDIIGSMQQQPLIPTLSTWSLIIFMLLLAGAALWKLKH
jgi:uncharacterized repeat protein (TIGR01451 family)